MKKLKEQRNRNETGLKQKYMKLANLRRILGDALLNNFQVINDGLKQKYMKLANLRLILGDALLNNFQVKKRRAVRNKICPPARQCCGSGSGLSQLDPDPLVKKSDPAPDLLLSSCKNIKKNLHSYCFVTSF